MALKSKIKQLEDIVTHDSESQLQSDLASEKPPAKPALIATQADLEEPEEDQIQELEMIPVGSIEEVSKKEIWQAREFHSAACDQQRNHENQVYEKRVPWKNSKVRGNWHPHDDQYSAEG